MEGISVKYLDAEHLGPFYRIHFLTGRIAKTP